MPTDQAFLESLTVRTIGRDVDLSTFQCKEEIVWFLQEKACDHHEKRMSVATCWLLKEQVVGYVTTSMGYTEYDNSTWRNVLGLLGVKYTRTGKDAKRFPAMLIGMLGVDERFRGRGLAREMVKFAVVEAIRASETIGCRIVHVDSDRTDEALGLYNSLGFTAPEGQDAKRGTVWMYFDLKSR